MFNTIQQIKKSISRSDIVIYSIIAIGTLLNLLFILPNGDHTCAQGICGIHIGEWHYHDALWHIAVARNSFRSFPFVFPSASGFYLTSYNYLLGAILSILELIRISPFFTYFKILPIVGNIMLVYSLFRYFRITKKTALQRIWISFFTYFGSSFSYFLILYRNDFSNFSILKGFPVVATIQPAFVLSNIQFFLTLPIILYIYTDTITKNKSKFRLYIHCGLLAISLGLKIYSGLFIFLLLVLTSVVNSLREKTYRESLLEIIFYGLTLVFATLIFFLPLKNQSYGSPFIWNPISIPHAITESPGLFYQKDFTLGRYFMYGLGRISPRLILYELISVFLFILWNLGSRIISFVYVVQAFLTKRFSLEDGVLLTAGSLGILFPTLFIQKGGGWYNTIQFAYISIYMFGILAGIYMASLWKNGHIVKRIIILIVVVATIPNNVLVLKLIAKEKIVIQDNEIKALEFLKKQPNGIVLSFPDDKNSSYVPALTGKTGYMIDYEQSALLNLPTGDMIKQVEGRDCNVLNKIHYIYVNNAKGLELIKCVAFHNNFKDIYHEGLIVIYGKTF